MTSRRRWMLSRKSLASHRRHSHEAIGEDFIVCLECGGQFLSLVLHVSRIHHMTADEYREKWGYGPLTALMGLETMLKFTRLLRERLAR